MRRANGKLGYRFDLEHLRCKAFLAEKKRGVREFRCLMKKSNVVWKVFGLMNT